MFISISTTASAAPNWVIDGETVYINTSKAYLGATPYMITQPYEWVFVELEVKNYNGNISAAFDMNVIPTEMYINKTYEETVGRSCPVNYPWVWANWTTSPKHVWCWFNLSGYTIPLWNHSYHSKHNPTYTVYWNETRQWKNIGHRLSFVEEEFNSKTGWYVIQNVSVISGKSYLAKVLMRPAYGIATTDKYDIAIYESSYGTNLTGAYEDNRMYLLDPWWNLTYRYSMEISNSTTIALPVNGTQYSMGNPQYCSGKDGDISLYYNNDSDEICVVNDLTQQINAHDDNCFIHFPFDTNETEIEDIASDNNATKYGLTHTSSCLYGGCYYFSNSTSDYVELSGVGFTNSTIATWFKVSDDIPANQDIYLIHVGPAKSNLYEKPLINLTLLNSSFSKIHIGAGGYCNNVSLFTNVSYNLSDGSWYHLAILTNSTNLTVYLNGTYVDGIACTPSTLTDEYLSIGKIRAHNDSQFKGYIDDFRLYNRTLTLSELNYLTGNSKQENMLLGSENDAPICDTCAGCNAKLAEATTGDIIYLQADLTTTGSCISVSNKDGIILDCNGSKISADGGGTGIKFSHVNNSIIRGGCNISSFSNGLDIQNSYNTTIQNIVSHNNTGQGIYAKYIDNSIIQHVNITHISNNGHGMTLWYSDNVTIRNNRLVDFDEGIRCQTDFNYVDIYDNYLNDSKEQSIVFWQSHYGYVHNNIIADAGADSIRALGSSSNHRIHNNTIHDTKIYLDGAYSINLTNNTFIDTDNGIRLEAPVHNVIISGNTFNEMPGQAIEFQWCGGNKVINASIYDNIFNTTDYFELDTDCMNDQGNYLNTTKQSGTNIINGPYIGGNYWTNSSGDGYSDTCADLDGDWICDDAYNLSTIAGKNFYDYLPLSPNLIAPTVTIHSPTVQNYTEGNLTLNVSADEIADTWWFSLDNGATNTSFTPNTTFIPNQGNNTLFVYANDSAGNTGDANVTFFVDSIAPYVSIISPINATTKTSKTLVIKIYLNDTNPANFTFNWNGVNTTYPYSADSQTNITKTGLNYQTYNFQVWVNDSYGNVNTTGLYQYTVTSQSSVGGGNAAGPASLSGRNPILLTQPQLEIRTQNALIPLSDYDFKIKNDGDYPISPSIEIPEDNVLDYLPTIFPGELFKVEGIVLSCESYKCIKNVKVKNENSEVSSKIIIYREDIPSPTMPAEVVGFVPENLPIDNIMIVIGVIILFGIIRYQNQ